MCVCVYIYIFTHTYTRREVAKYEHEVAQRTLKIQMLKTAVMPPSIVEDEDDF